eukprot:SAG31_NODE_493_length_14893_cov_20.429701_8_plen_243_part_00
MRLQHREGSDRLLGRPVGARIVRHASRPHGKGEYIYSNGDLYDGHWRDGLRHGTGTLRMRNGDAIHSNALLLSDLVHCSFSRDSFLSTRTSFLNFHTGDQYSGHFKADMFHGVGTYTFANGGIARSHWQNGKQHGQSRYIFSGRAQANSTVPVRSNQRRIVQPLVPARSCFDAKFGDCIASFVEGARLFEVFPIALGTHISCAFWGTGKPTGMRRGNVPSGLAEYQYKRWQFCPGRSSDGHL